MGHTVFQSCWGGYSLRLSLGQFSLHLCSPPMKPCSPQLEENQIGTHTHKIPLAYFAVSFQLLFQPFKVSVASPYRRLLYLEYGDVCLHVYIHKVSVFGEVGIVTKLSSRKLEIKKLYSYISTI